MEITEEYLQRLDRKAVYAGFKRNYTFMHREGYPEFAAMLE